jgi:hypothetical protein
LARAAAAASRSLFFAEYRRILVQQLRLKERGICVLRKSKAASVRLWE